MEGEWKEMSQHTIPEQKDYSYIAKRAIIELSAAAQHRALFLPILQKHLTKSPDQVTYNCEQDPKPKINQRESVWFPISNKHAAIQTDLMQLQKGNSNICIKKRVRRIIWYNFAMVLDPNWG